MMDLIDYGRFLAALLFVLGLIALTAWLARRFRLGPGGSPGAARRLAVLETLPLDPRRKLVLVRLRRRPSYLLLLGPPMATGCSRSRHHHGPARGSRSAARREAFG